MSEETNKQLSYEPSEKDVLRVLQGKEPLSDMPADELTLLSGLRDKILWDDAEQATQNKPDTDVDAAWSRMQTRIQQEQVATKQDGGSMTMQKESNVIQVRFLQFKQWLPLVASFAAFFVSVIVLMQVTQNEQAPITVAAKGAATNQSVQVSSTEQEAFIILGDLKQLFDVSDVQLSFKITLPVSAPLTEEQQRLMSQYQLHTEEGQSQVVIVVSE